MIIHVTKKLADKLLKAGFEVPAKSEQKPSRLGDWHANITSISHFIQNRIGAEHHEPANDQQ